MAAVVQAKKNDKLRKSKKVKEEDKDKPLEINQYLRLYNELTIPLLF